LKRTLELLSGLLCGSALFAIMALTFFDVIGRKALGQSIPGSLEVTELLMVIVIFAGLPLVSQRGEHVIFDTMDSYLPPRVLKAQISIVHLLSAAAMLGLAWVMWGNGNQFVASGETTAQLKLLKAPFIYGMSVLCAVTGLVHLRLAFDPAAELAQADAPPGGGVAL
jgi:TRAP-type transport system small permease protein